ncbi:MAG TPA: hypothetical protein VG675_19465 [Bryobacteraceae bacterium]|nr:hypothetical protein [Bryobacteraceae bacterium]
MPYFAKLFAHELPDAPDLGGNGIRLGAQDLPGDVVKLLLADVNLFHEGRGRAALRRSRGEVSDLLLKLLGTLTHPGNLCIEASEGSLQLFLEFLDGVFDGFRLEYGVLQFRKQVPLDLVSTLLQTIRASSTLEVDRTAVATFAVDRAPGYNGQVMAAGAALQDSR